MIPININPKKKIAIYVCDTDQKGTYPMRRAQTIADTLPDAIDVVFIYLKGSTPPPSTYQSVPIKDNASFINTLTTLNVDLLLRDSGSTSIEDVERITTIVPAVIHFDDFGEGGKAVDLVVQTLYTEDHEKQPAHYLVGPSSFIADEQLSPFKRVGLQSKQPQSLPHLVISFGEEDPGNLTYRALRHILQLQIPLKVTVLLGEKYSHDKTELQMMALGRRNTHVKERQGNPLALLATADIILCASGYMPYEIAFMGIPCIVLAQNDFEASLDFPKEKHGFIHLGPGRKVKQSSLLNAIMEPLLHESLRTKAINRQLALNLGEGGKIICEAILYALEQPKRLVPEGKRTSDML